MESTRRSADTPLIVIVGPTASGKTAVAIELAKKYNGEIICADSRTIFKGMDIGTAKPTKVGQEEVSHWGLDLVEPGQRFTAADFKKYAEQKIAEIRARNRIPFLVGGTGLYVDAVLFNYQFGKENFALRSQLESMNVNELSSYCIQHNIELPQNTQNKRYLIRAIEQGGINHKRNRRPIDNSIIVGVATDKELLNERIAKRTEQLFEDGVVEEAIKLGKKYGWESEAFTGNAYRVLKSYLLHKLNKSDAKEKITTLDRQLAKRQRTWFQRNPAIHWASIDEIKDYVASRLATQ